ncbi:MAG: rRNA pseudouridine synthase [Proteobacteria bacterium]|nr:rRNA pseudouridine synthase [Pseudomonadota bacterium]MCP4919312.1 rRNA pseudouridine synthase [Pseudomonadota bacterium]
MAQKLARLIASRGLASRREAETWIKAGRVEVNGEIDTNVATVVDDTDRVRVDDRPLPPAPPLVYMLLYKPRGYITTRNDPNGRRTVFELLDDYRGPRVEPVGRLDFDTEGVLLLTNDGDLAHKLTHPSSHVPKRYLAKIWRVPNDQTLTRIRKGIHLDDGKTGPCKVRVAEATDSGNCWLEVTVTEGRNRLVRRMLETVNHPVSKLRRESFATLSIRGLERGEMRSLTRDELIRIRELAAGKDPGRAGKSHKYKKGHARPKPKKTRMGSRRSKKPGGRK